jgi:hypothetical protein
MSSVSSVLMNSDGRLSAAHDGEDIFLPGMKTTLPPTKKERGKSL